MNNDEIRAERKRLMRLAATTNSATEKMNCSAIVTEYVAGLEPRFNVVDRGEFCVIVTPFERSDGDFLEMYAELNPTTGGLRLTDSGDTVDFLFQSGLSLGGKTLQDIRRVANQFGARLDVNELCIDVDDTNTQDQSFHGLLQALVNVSRFVEKRRPPRPKVPKVFTL